MENRAAFWQQIPKVRERTASKSERRHHGACGPSALTVKLVDARTRYAGGSCGARLN